MCMTVPLCVCPDLWLLCSPVLCVPSCSHQAGPISVPCGQPTCEQVVEVPKVGMWPGARRLSQAPSLWSSCLQGLYL